MGSVAGSGRKPPEPATRETRNLRKIGDDAFPDHRAEVFRVRLFFGLPLRALFGLFGFSLALLLLPLTFDE